MIEQVGRSLEIARVAMEGGQYIARYMTREQVLLTTDDLCGKYAALPTRLLVNTMLMQAQLMQRFADECDNYAMSRFDPPVLMRYLESIR